jgi:hypothetical protein
MRITTIICAVFFALVMLAAPTPTPAQVSVGISVSFAPPELPVYEQPICPGDGYIWTPGYWAWDEDADDYYWVPGTWVLAPEVGFLWTPGWWGWGGSAFIFHEGYWGPHVGFYGGVVYGFGYFGHGYEGGRWDGDHFFYNRAVNNVNVTVIHNVYNKTVVNNYTNVTRVSYNGGNGGINERPTREEESYQHERRVPPVAMQTQHVQAARTNPQLRASYNHGKPPVAATPRPGAFNEHGVAAAKEGSYKAEASRPAPHAGATGGGRKETNARTETNAGGHNAVHPNELPPAERRGPPNTGNAKLDQKYQQQQNKLDKQQTQERQRLQAQQEKEHQQVAKQNADEARKAQVEQKHQQQTQQMVQRHAQQQQNLQQKQQPHASAPPKGKH